MSTEYRLEDEETAVDAQKIDWSKLWQSLKAQPARYKLEWKRHVVTFVVGATFGLTVLGWGVWPVEWTGVTLDHVTAVEQQMVTLTLAELNMFDDDNDFVDYALATWPNVNRVACAMAGDVDDVTQRIKLVGLVGGCDEAKQ